MHHGPLSKRLAGGLTVLRERIARAGIPSSCLDETLTLATWNIREFGRRRRKCASLHYIAEIVGQFDLVAIVELRDDTSDLEQVLEYLGPYWHVVYSDYNIDRAGNHERIGFVFDRRAVTFTGLASNIHAARTTSGRDPDWWRAPYIASFRAGSFDFALLAAHIRWGGDGKAAEAERVPELKLLAEWIHQRSTVSSRAGAHRSRGPQDLIVVGDFNIPATTSELYKVITSRGLRMPDALLGEHGTNLEKDKRYDQILHLPVDTAAFTGLGGSLDFWDGDATPLYPGERLAKADFTYEMSDHLPLWVQIRTDCEALGRDRAS